MAIDINIPSQVKTYANLSGFPATGSLKTIFIAEDTNKTYRWTGTAYVEVSAAGASGITIGTTAITSGTVGRVLFEGTGNVVQESANLFWDNANGRLGIGTSSPAFRLEVQGGDVRFANGVTIGTAGSAGWQFSSNTVTLIQNGFLGVDVANGRTFGITNTAFSTFYFRIAEITGNIGINTTTDAGYKLDVNGTARVQDRITVVKSENSAFDGVSIQNLNSVQTTIFRAKDNSTGVCEFGLGGTSSSFPNDAFFYTNKQVLAFYANTLERMRIASTGNVLIGATTDAGYKLDVNGTARVVGQATIQTLTIGLGGGAVATNTALGLNALTSNTTGANNTSVGRDSLRANTIGDYNTSIGLDALRFNTGGGQNTAVGWRALNSVLTGYGNVAVGAQALISTTGGFNIGIGERAGESNTTGTYNICIGAQTQTGNFSNSVILGRSATATADNQFVVGTSTYNVGSVTTEVNASTQVWNVIINGVARKILLA